LFKNARAKLVLKLIKTKDLCYFIERETD